MLSERLKLLRTEKHLRQEDIAKGIGVATLTYQRYEYGDREPLASVLSAMADYFHVSADYLLGRSDNR